MNRTIAPEVKPITDVELPAYKKEKLDIDVPLYIINEGSQEVVCIDFVFEAGTAQQKLPYQASSVSALLKEGTASYTSLQISEALDYYGAFLQTGVDKDFATVTLYVLSKHLEKVLPYVEEVITCPTFLDEELAHHLVKSKQSFLVNKEKNDYIARNEFSKAVFGEKHPYGLVGQLSDFESINTVSLKEFYKLNYSSSKCKIFLSGNVDAGVLSILNTIFSTPWNEGNTLKKQLPEIIASPIKKVTVAKEKSVQSAIRIGRRVVDKSHPDFILLQMASTVLGGYFGSRLMSNIREDKGYTYGIGSFVYPMKEASYFGIATEVGVDVTTNAIKEIYKEIALLRDELVPQEELELVKSYLMGEILKSVDGPFSIAERWKGMLLYDLDKTYFEDLIKTVKSVTPEQIKEVANTYFQPKDLYEIVVGAV